MTTVATHNEDFHADDIFAVATLRILLGKDVEIIRTRDKSLLEKADYVVDVGGIYDIAKKRFDHHQEGGAGVRENGIPYAAFGLVWKEYGPTICNSTEVAQSIDSRFVQAIDGPDNGIEIASLKYPNLYVPSFHSITMVFRPTWNEDSSENELNARFTMLVDLAEIYLRRLIQTTKDYLDGKAYVFKAYEEASDKRVIILDNHYPFHEVLLEFPEPLYVVYPRKEGSWNVKAVRKTFDSFQNRKDFPESWAGKSDEELQKITGVDDAVFCHNKRFLVVSRTKEGALSLAKKALEA